MRSGEEENGSQTENNSENEVEIQKIMQRISFDEYKETASWEDYIFRFEKICKTKGLGGQGPMAAMAKRDLLLAYVGLEPLRKVKHCFFPKDLEECTFAEIKSAFQQLFRPQRTLFAARIEFEQVRRKPGDSFAEFANRLRELCCDCNYGNTLDERLRDRFISGINHEKVEIEVRQKWPDGTDISGQPVTFRQVFDLATAIERAENELHPKSFRSKPLVNRITDIRNGSAPGGTKGNERENKKAFRKEAETKSSQRCGRCGRDRHKDMNDCPARKAKCRRCGKMGHFAERCTSKVDRNQSEMAVRASQQIHQIEENDPFPETDLNGVYEVQALSSRATINVQLEGQECEMEFDSGAQVSIIPEEWWHRLNCPTLEAAPKLTVYGQKPLQTLGSIRVNVTLGNQQLKLPVAVVKASDKPLFGLPWIMAFKLPMSEHVKIQGVDRTPLTIDKWRQEGETLIEEFSDVFNEENIGTIKDFQAKLHLKEGVKPIAYSARRTPFPLRKPVELELRRLETRGVIEKVNPAVTPILWSTPTVNVLKPDGTVRICGDFRVTVNPNLVADAHLMPTFDDLISRLVGGQEFTIIDLKDAYLQMEIEESSRRCLIIATHVGYFQYKRLPFGLSCSPSVFQRYMENLLEGIDQVGIFLDDVIITGKTPQEHLNNLREVLERFRAAGLRAKKSKLRLFEPEVEYLGHKIDAHGVHPTEEKVAALKNTPSPTNVKELRAFLGAINFYEKFIPNLHPMCSELHKLTGTKATWKWTSVEEEIFNRVKNSLASTATLAKYDEKLPLILCCDASEKGVGAVLLCQWPNGKEQPIAYASRTLTNAEKNYSSIDREALALVYAVTKFHQYVYGRKFTLCSDHKPLERIFGEKRNLSKITNHRLIRWALILSGYDYEIKYRKATDNACADSLSRLPCSSEADDTEANALRAIHLRSIEDLTLTEALIRQRTRRDPTLSRVQRFLESGWPKKRSSLEENLKTFFDKRTEISCENGVLMWGNRIIIPSSLRNKVLNILHEGHLGIEATRSVARFHVWWPNLDVDIESLVKDCRGCQENRDRAREVPLFSWNIPDNPWDRVHIDLTGPFEGKVWLILIDAYSKWAEVQALERATAEDIIYWLRQWFARFGIPRQIVTDNGPQFREAKFLTEFDAWCKRNAIQHIRNTPYHPKTNGLVERFVHTFKQRYRATIRDTQEENLVLAQVLMAYRNAPQKTTGYTPAELLLGRRIPCVLDRIKPDPKKHAQAQLWKQKIYHDQRSQMRDFQPGMEVWVKKETRKGWKPGVVVRKTGELSYQVRVGGQILRKHADQLRVRTGAVDDMSPDEEVATSDSDVEDREQGNFEM